MDARLPNRLNDYRNALSLAFVALDKVIEVSPEEALGEIALTEINLQAARKRAKEAQAKKK